MRQTLGHLGIDILPSGKKSFTLKEVTEDGITYHFAHIYAEDNNAKSFQGSLIAFSPNELYRQLKEIYNIDLDISERNLDNFLEWYNGIGGWIAHERVYEISKKF